MSASSTYDIVIIGLGPAGAVLAGLAALEGLSVLAVEREPEPYPLPRAAVFDDEVMRIFQRLGVARTILPLCRTPTKFQFLDAAREVLVEMPVGGMPTPSGWEASYGLHQPAVEAALRRRAGELGAEMRLGVSFRSFEQDDDGVTVRLEGPRGPEAVRGRYLVGCDGARSPVREQAALTLFDFGFNEPWLVLDVLSDAHDELPQVGLQVCDPSRPTTFMRMTGDRYRWEFMMVEGDTPDAMMEEDFIRTLLAKWLDPDLVRIERKALYTFHGLVANEWRSGRVLIAGDAAHQMPPFAGQGMCAGVRDAGNLAWKFGAVIRGEADARLLDSYQTEREPHARAVIGASIGIGQIVCLRDPQAVAFRDAEMRARHASGEPPVSTAYPPLRGGCLTTTQRSGELFPQPWADGVAMDDRLARQFWLIGRELPGTLPPWVAGYELGSEVLEPYAPAIEGWLDQAGASAVLVRPDRHVFGVGEPAVLLSALDAAMSRTKAAAPELESCE